MLENTIKEVVEPLLPMNVELNYYKFTSCLQEDSDNCGLWCLIVLELTLARTPWHKGLYKLVPYLRLRYLMSKPEPADCLIPSKAQKNYKMLENTIKEVVEPLLPMNVELNYYKFTSCLQEDSDNCGLWCLIVLELTLARTPWHKGLYKLVPYLRLRYLQGTKNYKMLENTIKEVVEPLLPMNVELNYYKFTSCLQEDSDNCGLWCLIVLELTLARTPWHKGLYKLVPYLRLRYLQGTKNYKMLENTIKEVVEPLLPMNVELNYYKFTSCLQEDSDNCGLWCLIVLELTLARTPWHKGLYKLVPYLRLRYLQGTKNYKMLENTIKEVVEPLLPMNVELNYYKFTSCLQEDSDNCGLWCLIVLELTLARTPWHKGLYKLVPYLRLRYLQGTKNYKMLENTIKEVVEPLLPMNVELNYYKFTSCLQEDSDNCGLWCLIVLELTLARTPWHKGLYKLVPYLRLRYLFVAMDTNDFSHMNDSQFELVRTMAGIFGMEALQSLAMSTPAEQVERVNALDAYEQGLIAHVRENLQAQAAEAN
ncbi:hypothetical protein PInf_002706 [Phytophthora infestans]|nr:hypothetical protein PInf_002706 [Phytophthora infestans]